MTDTEHRAVLVSIDAMLEAYIDCALWSSTHFESESDGGTPFDEIDAELAAETVESMEKDCRAFVEDIEKHDIPVDDYLDDARIGHDFWLTRNRHGTGFWDRELDAIGDQLTALAEDVYGSSDLYLGDDGKIHVQ